VTGDRAQPPESLSAFNYELPAELIAQEPLADRSASRLLYLHRDSGVVEHKAFSDVLELLRPGDLLVLNNTRVTARRLFGRKKTGGAVELLVLSRNSDGSYKALARPGKRLPPGVEVELDNGLSARIIEDLGNGRKRVCIGGDISRAGVVPLPPYIHSELRDEERYQTVYASAPGSAAAPTAGLHFTSSLLDNLQANGVDSVFVTLDVGLDTFRPVTAENLDQHQMHGETCTVPDSTVSAVANCKGRVIAVGTTSVRTLESFAIGKRRLKSGTMNTSLFIRPGFEFQVVDGMFTNFHMPRTTMLIMLAAFAGRENVMNAYEQAVRKRYRFLSFGDSMLIL